MERGLAKVKQYPLSDGDIRKVLGDDISIVNYPMLEGMGSIDEAFDKKGRCVLLFPNSSPTSGHWCAMIRRPDSIEFFDPYGDKPETQKKGLSEEEKQEYNIDQPLLTQLFKQSGLPVYYNGKGFQEDKSSIATCGRHAISRLLYAPDSLETYDKKIKTSGMKPDDFVSGLTYNALHK
jgi:hypothetical protein